MRLVHVSDCHLGFRQYQRLTPRGINQREADVAQSFAAAITQTIRLAPELVVVAGDVFHAPRPPTAAVVHAFQQIERLRTALPRVSVVVIAGNHDTARAADTGSFLPLFRSLGVRVVEGAAQAIDFPDLDCSVLAVPDNQYARPELRPVGHRRYNVLLLHGETGGISPAGSPAAAKEIPPEAMHADAWDYTALGHYHVYRETAPRAYYAGATDYTSSNLWGERAEEQARGVPGKGIVERDLATGAQTFHPLPATRAIVDLPSLSAEGMTLAEASAAIATVVEAIDGGIEGKIVRLVVQDVDLPLARGLDQTLLRGYRRRALHFQLVTQRPVRARSALVDAYHRRASLDELVAAMLRDRALPAGVDRAAFVALGTKYLEDVAERDLTAAVA